MNGQDDSTASAHRVEWTQVCGRAERTMHMAQSALAANQALGVVHRPPGVGGGLVLGRVTDEALRVRERHVRRRDAVALVVGDDLHAPVLVDADTGVGRAQIDADDGALGLCLCRRLIRLLRRTAARRAPAPALPQAVELQKVRCPKACRRVPPWQASRCVYRSSLMVCKW